MRKKSCDINLPSPLQKRETLKEKKQIYAHRKSNSKLAIINLFNELLEKEMRNKYRVYFVVFFFSVKYFVLYELKFCGVSSVWMISIYNRRLDVIIMFSISSISPTFSILLYLSSFSECL